MFVVEGGIDDAKLLAYARHEFGCLTCLAVVEGQGTVQVVEGGLVVTNPPKAFGKGAQTTSGLVNVAVTREHIGGLLSEVAGEQTVGHTVGVQHIHGIGVVGSQIRPVGIVEKVFRERLKGVSLPIRVTVFPRNQPALDEQVVFLLQNGGAAGVPEYSAAAHLIEPVEVLRRVFLYYLLTVRTFRRFPRLV